MRSAGAFQLVAAQIQSESDTLQLEPYERFVFLSQFFSFMILMISVDASTLQVLLDQTQVVCGIGNWLADDILFDAKIHPCERFVGLADVQIERLRKSIETILSKAVAVNADASKFPQHWLFHVRWTQSRDAQGLKNHKDASGGKTKLVVTTVGQRTTLYDELSQKLSAKGRVIEREMEAKRAEAERKKALKTGGDVAGKGGKKAAKGASSSSSSSASSSKKKTASAMKKTVKKPNGKSTETSSKKPASAAQTKKKKHHSGAAAASKQGVVAKTMKQKGAEKPMKKVVVKEMKKGRAGGDVPKPGFVPKAAIRTPGVRKKKSVVNTTGVDAAAAEKKSLTAMKKASGGAQVMKSGTSGSKESVASSKKPPAPKKTSTGGAGKKTAMVKKTDGKPTKATKKKK